MKLASLVNVDGELYVRMFLALSLASKKPDGKDHFWSDRIVICNVNWNGVWFAPKGEISPFDNLPMSTLFCVNAILNPLVR